MFDLNTYLDNLFYQCKEAFGTRLVYMGLQGSYLRGEASEKSDIDVMLVLDDFSVRDMDAYRDILKQVGWYEKSCGFICGKNDLARWNPLEALQLRFTTKDVYGTLADLLPCATRADEINYVKISLGNFYHEICWRYIHADETANRTAFRASCKALFFVIQNLHYLETGTFILKKSDLKAAVSPEDRTMLCMSELRDDFDFCSAYSAVFAWCQRAFCRLAAVS